MIPPESTYLEREVPLPQDMKPLTALTQERIKRNGFEFADFKHDAKGNPIAIIVREKLAIDHLLNEKEEPTDSQGGGDPLNI